MYNQGYKVGDTIHIIHIEDHYVNYDGRVGTITHIDSANQLHGTWGGVDISEEYGDKFEKVD